MEFEITYEQLHSAERGVFSKPASRRGGGRQGRKGASSSSLFAHISQQQDAEYTPLRQATTSIHELYKRCNPAFLGNTSHIPARLLTQPSEPLSEAVPYDNKEGNLIARVYDQISVPGEAYHYTVMDLLGTGTFGQVFRCLKEANEPEAAEGEDEGEDEGENEDEDEGEGRRRRRPSEVVAVKVVKGKPAYRTQGLLEVKIAKMVNRLGDPEDKHNLVRCLDSFEDRGHVCIVFELLSCSLLDVLTQNQFRGLPLEVVQRFTVQLLAALAVLQDTNIIHCDLKPENILLCPKHSSSSSSASSAAEEKQGAPASRSQKGAVDLKVIDFGSACFEGKTMYSYIQSRFYRSPEVLLGVPYNGAIDIWSLGCVCAEMYLGLPLFPGASQHNQLTRIIGEGRRLFTSLFLFFRG
jgi:dual specificity protein kinase YAK1